MHPEVLWQLPENSNLHSKTRLQKSAARLELRRGNMSFLYPEVQMGLNSSLLIRTRVQRNAVKQDLRTKKIKELHPEVSQFIGNSSLPNGIFFEGINYEN
jgi:hypothetical protein